VVRKMVVGVDVGGSTTKSCIVDGNTTLASAVVPTTLGTPADLGDLAVTAVNAAIAESDHRISDLAGIGVGVPGQVSSGHVRNAANLGIDEAGYDLQGHVTTATGVPASIENDMTVAAFGAYSQLSLTEPTLENLVYIGLGTGVSAGVVLNRNVFRGSRDLAGEFGHVPMGTGLECACGSVGCLETAIGANGLRDAWQGEMTTTLFAAAAGGDKEAEDVVERAVGFLSTAMWWLAAAYDPDYFLIGGGLGVNNPSIKGLITAQWAEMSSRSALARRVLDPDRIRISDLEEPVGAYGAALLAARDVIRPEDTSPENNWEEEMRK
jgi:predicted NBD/HSP70 family sugar kinase